MPWFPDPNGGAPIQAATNPNPAGGSLGFYSDPSYNGPPPGGAVSTPSVPSAAQPIPTQPTQTSAASTQLANGINSLLGAIASGNKQAFDEAVRQFNVTSGLDQSKFDESVRQFNQNFGVTQAGLTGMYQGQQTQQAQAQAFNEALSAAGLTGYWNPPTAPSAAPGAAPTSGPLTRYQPGTVVRTASNQFGVVGANGTLTPGDTSNPSIYQAIQAGQGIQTVTDAEFAAAQQAASAAGAGTQSAYIAARSQQLQGMGMPAQQAAQTAQSEWAQGLAQSGNVAGGMPPGFSLQAPTAGGAQAGTPTLAAQAQYAGLYGNAGQAPTPGQTTLAAQQQAYTQQLGAINAAAALQANPFRQQQVIGQLGPLLSGIGGVAGFSAPNTVQGVGTQGGTGPNTGLAYMQQMIDDIKNPGANQASMQGVLDAIPTPNKINSQDFMRSAPSTQNLVLQGMQEKYGLDPNDSLAQIKNTLPQFTSPTTFGKIAG